MSIAPAFVYRGETINEARIEAGSIRASSNFVLESIPCVLLDNSFQLLNPSSSNKMQRRTIKGTLTLSNSVKIPQLGFGVYQSSKDHCIKTCLTALENGYRHIDTAQYYGNEDEVGRAVEKSGLDRRDVFITTKVLSAEGSVEKNYQKCLASVKTLDTKSEYVDLFLIHSPNCGFRKRKELWLALEKLYHEGKAKSIGVSNFGIGQIEELKQFASVWPPHVCQIEVRQPNRCRQE